MRPQIIGFSGRIKGGKTTLSQAVAESLRWPRVSFGDYVRSVARDRGLDADSRSIQQAIGESLIQQGWPEFCRAVVATANWQPGSPIIVDGIRHLEAIREIRRMTAPLPFVLVHVAVSDQVQAGRFQNQGQESDALAAAESHSTEADVKAALPTLADLVVDGAKPIAELMQEVLAFVQR